MPRTARSSSIADRVEQLLRERQNYTESIAQIDQMLDEISGLLGESRGRGRRGRKPRTGGFAGRRGKRRGRRGSYESTASELILKFVKEHRNPTTQEIRAYWQSQGRGGTSDNALSKMVKEGVLDRVKVRGERGSRYTAA